MTDKVIKDLTNELVECSRKNNLAPYMLRIPRTSSNDSFAVTDVSSLKRLKSLITKANNPHATFAYNTFIERLKEAFVFSFKMFFNDNKGCLAPSLTIFLNKYDYRHRNDDDLPSRIDYIVDSEFVFAIDNINEMIKFRKIFDYLFSERKSIIDWEAWETVQNIFQFIRLRLNAAYDIEQSFINNNSLKGTVAEFISTADKYGKASVYNIPNFIGMEEQYAKYVLKTDEYKGYLKKYLTAILKKYITTHASSNIDRYDFLSTYTSRSNYDDLMLQLNCKGFKLLLPGKSSVINHDWITRRSFYDILKKLKIRRSILNNIMMDAT